jgi:Helix-turn-helix domain
VTGRKGVVLRWQAGLRANLKRKRPGNQHRILAVAIVLVGYANPDGTQCNVSQRTIADETGQSHGHVNDALAWLIEHGW